MMKRREAIQTMIAPLLAPAVLRGSPRAAGSKPNLLFLWTDEQRADTMAVYGNYRFHVPTMNRLASRSIVFQRCYDTQPVCTPARSSVMTGLWPHQNGCITNNISLKSDTRTLPELLNDPDYRTGYFGKWHLGDEPFAQHGFEEWVSVEDIYVQHFSPGRDPSKRSSYHHYLLDLGYKPDNPDGTFSRVFKAQRPLGECKPAFLASHASDFILRYRSSPWILYVNFLEPHMPFYGPLNDLHSDQEAPIPASYAAPPPDHEPERYRKRREKQKVDGVSDPDYLVLPGHDLKDRAAVQRVIRNYAGLCAQVDQALARILWALDASGQADNTIVVFTTDHGEMMGAHGLFGKGTFYEEAVRVPMLIRVPFRYSRRVVVAEPVSHIDLVPTLLELLGAKSPGFLPGESLLPRIAGGVPGSKDVIVEWHAGPSGRMIVAEDGWKLGLYDTGNCLLFNRERDPLELENLYYRKEHADVTRRLRARIEQWQHKAKDTLKLPPPV